MVLLYPSIFQPFLLLIQIFSFGFEEEIKSLLAYFPTVYQAVLASATLSEEVLTLKRLILHNPAILKLEEPFLAPPTQLAHYTLSAEENDKAAIIYALLKLNLVRYVIKFSFLEIVIAFCIHR